VVTNSCVCFFTHEAAGALGARHSLRPLISEGGTFLANLARIARRDREVMFERCCLKFEMGELAPPSLRAKRSNPYRRGEGMDCFVASLLAMTVSPRRAGEAARMAAGPEAAPGERG
jgi:hypothetical protein